MAKGITGKEPDPEVVYGDIFHHPHWRSPKHPPMSLYDRAAQFAPFAALTGYEDMIDEEARQVDRRIELGEEEMAALNEALSGVRKALEAGKRPEVLLTWFIQDPLKAGGRYETAREKVKGFDPAGGRLILERKSGRSGANAEIRLEDILAMEAALTERGKEV